MWRLAELANTKIKWLTKRLVINALTKPTLHCVSLPMKQNFRITKEMIQNDFLTVGETVEIINNLVKEMTEGESDE